MLSSLLNASPVAPKVTPRPSASPTKQTGNFPVDEDDDVVIIEVSRLNLLSLLSQPRETHTTFSSFSFHSLLHLLLIWWISVRCQWRNSLLIPRISLLHLRQLRETLPPNRQAHATQCRYPQSYLPQYPIHRHSQLLPQQQVHLHLNALIPPRARW